MDAYMVLLLSILSTCWVATQTSSGNNMQAKYNTIVHIPCDWNDVLSNSRAIQITWIIPTGELVQIHSSEYKHNDYKFLNYGEIMQIPKLDDEHFGIYYCMAKFPNGTILIFKHGLNVDGPYFGNLLEKYSSHAITGAVAAGIMFCAATIVCFLCSRSQAKGQAYLETFRAENPGMYWQPFETTKLDSYDNLGLNMDEVNSREVSDYSSGDVKKKFNTGDEGHHTKL